MLYNQLKDNQRALAACKAGWAAHNAPELAWCAGFVSIYMQQYSEAKEWAQRAIALGCFKGGSCQPLEALVPEHSQLPVQSCSWEGPWDVLVWANKGLGDTAGEAEALQTQRTAEDARKQHEPSMRMALGRAGVSRSSIAYAMSLVSRSLLFQTKQGCSTLFCLRMYPTNCLCI